MPFSSIMFLPVNFAAVFIFFFFDNFSFTPGNLSDQTLPALYPGEDLFGLPLDF